MCSLGWQKIDCFELTVLLAQALWPQWPGAAVHDRFSTSDRRSPPPLRADIAVPIAGLV
jgi:hypothetical protein